MNAIGSWVSSLNTRWLERPRELTNCLWNFPPEGDMQIILQVYHTRIDSFAMCGAPVVYKRVKIGIPCRT